MISGECIEAAQKRLEGKINKTPLSYDSDLDVYIKWENHQNTGAFKIRGALNKILSLEKWEQERGLVAASAGNHGLGVAYAARLLGIRATVFIPENTTAIKEEAMIEYGAVVKKIAADYSEAEKEAQAYAIKKGSTWISPYNDGQVIAGYATLVQEMVEQIVPFDASACIVPVCGGGLIAAVGLAFRHLQMDLRLIGVQSKNSAYFYSLYQYGSQKDVVESKSIADGLTGAIEKNSMTIPLVRSMLDDFILVEEEEIEQAIVFCYKKYHQIIEGSAAVPLAAVLFHKIKIPKSILILTGGNIQQDAFSAVFQRWEDWDIRDD
jgi:threonine dehydratase